MRHSRPPNLKEKLVGNEKPKIRLCSVIGSGGHTTEMLAVMEQLGEHYSNRVYIVADTDRLGETKVLHFERSRASGTFEIVYVPRSREVGQSYFTSVYTTIRAILYSFMIIWQARPDVLLCNGPGTCLPICIVAFLYDLFRLRNTRIFFIESTCRVKSLSLTAIILYHLRIPDSILVQWPDLVKLYPRTEYIGRLS
uniref:UDP-N-acetylglucosamine transferase subunit ALG14 n=1 Tax=Acrobeloides nanus TaxID=290746 RepID=A0A914D8K2_9BILA